MHVNPLEFLILKIMFNIVRNQNFRKKVKVKKNKATAIDDFVM